MPEGGGGGGRRPQQGGARRGQRRSAAEITLDPEQLDDEDRESMLKENLGRDADDPASEEPTHLYAGDRVMGKVVHTVQFDGVDSWFTYGVETRVQEGESELDAYIRVSEVCNTRSLDLAADAEEHINALRERVQHEAAIRRRDRRIVARDVSRD